MSPAVLNTKTNANNELATILVIRYTQNGVLAIPAT